MATETATKADLAEVRRSIRESAREVEERHLADLERVDAGPGRMAAPAIAYKRRTGWGSYEYRRNGDWDWFDALSRDEQARLRERWFSTSPTAQSPDEIFQKISQREWLENTRIIDASRALASGRIGEFNPKRYGGLSPNHLVAGTAYDVKVLWSSDEDKARRHLARGQAGHKGGLTWGERAWEFEPDRSRCQFFTDERGVVHPIRATCGGNEEPEREYSAEDLEEF